MSILYFLPLISLTLNWHYPFLAPTCMRARRHQNYLISTLHQVIRILCNPICVFNYIVSMSVVFFFLFNTLAPEKSIKKKNCLIIAKRWIDGWVKVLHPFNSISVISRRWKGEHERLCAVKRRLGSGRISPSAGFEPATPWSEVGGANRSATRMLQLQKRKTSDNEIWLTGMVNNTWWFIEYYWKLFILVGLGRSFFVCCLAHRGSTVGFLLLQCSSDVVRHPGDLRVSVATRSCRVLIFASS